MPLGAFQIIPDHCPKRPRDNARHQRPCRIISLYYNSERKPPSKYYELHPGIATTEKVQQEIIKGMKENNTRLVVLIKSGISTEPNLSSISSEVFLLDEYIEQNFEKAEEFGDYVIKTLKVNSE